MEGSLELLFATKKKKVEFRFRMIDLILFVVFYLSLLNNFHEVRLVFAGKTNSEFGLFLSIFNISC